jgi:hypothetical protein
MKIKTMSVEKIDVQKLSGDQLTVLKQFEKSDVFKILEELAEESKTRRAFAALQAEDIKDLSMLGGINVGVDFIVDAVQRAKEELKSRGDVDSEEEIK